MKDPYYLQWLSSLGIDAIPGNILMRAIVGLMVILISIVTWLISRKPAYNLLPKLVSHTKNHWDDLFMQNNAFRNLTLIIPGIILTIAIPSVFNGDAYSANVTANIVSVYLIFAGALCVDALMNSLLDIYRTLPLSQEIPLTGFVQITKIVLYSCGMLFVIAIILNRSPLAVWAP